MSGCGIVRGSSRFACIVRIWLGLGGRKGQSGISWSGVLTRWVRIEDGFDELDLDGNAERILAD